ncbi:MAG: SUMF1/EgtB/PvdO family nonheme iron enzyme [Myxococcota bacterium]
MRVLIASTALLPVSFAVGCLDTVEPPPPTPTASVSVPDRLFLAGSSPRRTCERLFSVTSTSELGTLTPVDGLQGILGPNQDDQPHNCYLDLDRTAFTGDPALAVEVHEVTNLQYQLCFDSGACRAPDPSEEEAGDICQDEDDFDDCPVIGVSYEGAENYCEWVGRRLPSGLEAMLIRQGAVETPATTTGTVSPLLHPNFPLDVPLLPTGADTVPNDCGQSVLGNSGDCDRPFRVKDGSTLGAAQGDALVVREGKGTGTIFDLIGNVAEWTSDLDADERGNASDLPWFCSADLPPFDPDDPTNDNTPTCPDGRACVRGRYRPHPNLPLRDDWPVCVASSVGQTFGFRPVLVGASFAEQLLPTDAGTDGQAILNARTAAGVFARRTFARDDPNSFGSTIVGRRTGFRCVGQRASASGNDQAPNFSDRVVPRTQTNE